MESKYKIGDRVRVKSLDWYNANKGKFDNIVLGGVRPSFTHYMSRYCGQVMTIVAIDSEYGDYTMKEDNGDYSWDAEMFEGVVDADQLNVYGELDNPMVDDIRIDDFQDDNELGDIVDDCVHRLKGNECQIALPEGYQFVDNQGNIIDTPLIMMKKKGVEYPKDYDECCNVLDDDDKMSLGLMNELRKLINARNAYWKLYGKANGLGGAWKPDYKKERYVIHRLIDEIVKGYRQAGVMEHFILEFPTEELRDMFYERFKKEIELCKELI